MHFQAPQLPARHIDLPCPGTNSPAPNVVTDPDRAGSVLICGQAGGAPLHFAAANRMALALLAAVGQSRRQRDTLGDLDNAIALPDPEDLAGIAAIKTSA